MADHSKMSMSWWAAAVVVVFAFVVLSPQRASAVAVRGREGLQKKARAEAMPTEWKCGNWTAEFLLIYDLSASYADDIPQLNLTAPVLFDKMREQFPGAKFALATFRDKPVFMKEEAPDHCFVTQHPMTHDTTEILKLIPQLETAEGVHDDPEAQRDALFHGLMSETVGWTTTESNDYGTQILRVVIMATDEIPHPANDAKHLNFRFGTTAHFIPHNGTSEPMCNVLDYPDDKLIKKAFKQRGAVPLFLIVGEEHEPPYWNLTREIGQGGTVLSLAHDSSNLAKMVAKGLYDITCKQLPPPTPRPGSPAAVAAVAEETAAVDAPKINKNAAVIAGIVVGAILAFILCVAAAALAYVKLVKKPPAAIPKEEATEHKENLLDRERQVEVDEAAFR